MDVGQLEHAQAVCRRIIDDWDQDEPLRARAVTLYATVTELKIINIKAAARSFAPRLCQRCEGRQKGHRSSCITCPRGEPVAVRIRGRYLKGIVTKTPARPR